MLDNLWFVRLVFACLLLTPAVSWLIYSKYPMKLLKIVPLGLVLGAVYFSVSSVGNGYGFGFAGIIWAVGFIVFLYFFRKVGTIEASYLGVFLVLFTNNIWGTEDSLVSFYTGYFRLIPDDIINFSLFYIIYFVNIPFFYNIVNLRTLAKYFLIFCIIFIPLNLLIVPIRYEAILPNVNVNYTNITYAARTFWILAVLRSVSTKIGRYGVKFFKIK